MIHQNIYFRILKLLMNNTTVYINKYYLKKRKKVQQYLFKYFKKVNVSNGFTLLLLLLKIHIVSLIRFLGLTFLNLFETNALR
jgi:hypothetical protein